MAGTTFEIRLSKRRGKVWSIDGRSQTSIGETRHKFCLDDCARNRNTPISTMVSPAYIQQFEVVTVMTDTYRVG
ncbi:hypothetical protein [Microcoleus sp. AR_TQ3_B6]|uniref:hypothetical protein n=1 Tax=Microcoleus sp. AR_TQ3_B6 TaxID=3055284 RepID=UPI002FD65C19